MKAQKARSEREFASNSVRLQQTHLMYRLHKDEAIAWQLGGAVGNSDSNPIADASNDDVLADIIAHGAAMSLLNAAGA